MTNDPLEVIKHLDTPHDQISEKSKKSNLLSSKSGENNKNEDKKEGKVGIRKHKNLKKQKSGNNEDTNSIISSELSGER